MIEKDAVRGMHAVGFAVVHHDPVGVELGRRVGAARIEGRGLALGHRLDLAVEFRGRRLIEPRLFPQTEDTDRFKQSKRADRVGIGGIFGRLKTDRHVRLGGQIINLVRLHLLHDPDQVGAVRQIAVVQDKSLIRLVRVLVKVFQAARVEGRRSPLDAVDRISLRQ